MSTFAVFFLCIIYIVQDVYGQSLYAGPAGPGYGLGYGAGLAPAAATGFAAPYGIGSSVSPLIAPAVEIPAIDLAGGYGGAGIGNVAVAGEMPVAGQTLVAGQVPILGAVRFAGDLPATGTVSISGSCGCGNSYIY